MVKHVHIVKDFFTTKEIDLFLTEQINDINHPFFETLTNFGNVQRYDPNEQKTKTKGVTPSADNPFITKLIYAGVDINAKVFRLPIAEYIPKYVEIKKYTGNEKSHLNIHCDDHTNTFRKLALVVFLSDPKDYTGGEFLLFDNEQGDGRVRVDQQKGSIIAFSSHVFHQVLPVLSGVRYSSVLWLS